MNICDYYFFHAEIKAQTKACFIIFNLRQRISEVWAEAPHLWILRIVAFFLIDFSIWLRSPTAPHGPSQESAAWLPLHPALCPSTAA